MLVNIVIFYFNSCFRSCFACNWLWFATAVWHIHMQHDVHCTIDHVFKVDYSNICYCCYGHSTFSFSFALVYDIWVLYSKHNAMHILSNVEDLFVHKYLFSPFRNYYFSFIICLILFIFVVLTNTSWRIWSMLLTTMLLILASCF